MNVYRVLSLVGSAGEEVEAAAVRLAVLAGSGWFLLILSTVQA